MNRRKLLIEYVKIKYWKFPTYKAAAILKKIVTSLLLFRLIQPLVPYNCNFAAEYSVGNLTVVNI